ncbi:MAG: hypothetical protein DI603_14755 [Roseateles depolymerans]|uniref:Putative DNA-binding domain-containing protein n=1 Tax=Roseateles depolymerans TaxID=76731 RepID=A0A2W5DEM5_9BURK|nr:MAG: hypothetical protein DI603_14755 [Roseateles depolymerans]
MLKDQQALVLALLGQGPAPEALRGGAERGLQAYANNLRVLSGQALAVPFGRIRSALGEADFAAMAWHFWRDHPPLRGDLAQWGQDLPHWLEQRAGADSGLPGLARLEWALHQAERAADAELDAGSLQRLADTDADRLGLRMRPGVTLVMLEAAAWARLDEPAADGMALVSRQGWRGTWQRLNAEDAALTGVLLGGGSLQQALAAAHAALQATAGPASVQGTDAAPDYDFAGWLGRALSESWLQSAHVLTLP